MTYEEFVEKLKGVCEQHNFTENPNISSGEANYKAFCFGGQTFYDVPGDEKNPTRVSPMVLVYQDRYDNMKPKIDYDELVFYTSNAGSQLVKCKTKTHVLKVDKFDWVKFRKWLIDQNQAVQNSLVMYKQRGVNKLLKQIKKDF